MWFHSDFSVSKHIQNVCKGCFLQLRDFRNIRQFLTHDASVSVANASVSSRLDYCNSLFRSFSKFNHHRLQSIQNSAVQTLLQIWVNILGSLQYSGNSIGIQFRSDFKLATLVCKFIHTGFPLYFAQHLSTYCTIYNTRRSQSIANFLNVPKFQKFTSLLSSLAHFCL